ncbi:glycosyltransferase [Kineococcus sp. GCM10028916]|uniref:glycosyltransferase n=1 Tax=Kineococcus sp. GCM10028916 TaxID=3273394 RepID=UPI00363E1FA4
MRILFSCTPAIGHLYPVLPLARAFARRGDDVALLTNADLAAALIGEPLTHLPAGAAVADLFAEVARRTGGDPAAAPTPEGVAEFFGATRLDLGGEDALVAARAWRPDLVVHELFDLVGPLVAADLRVPRATLTTGPATPTAFLDAIAASAAASFTDRGLPAPAGLSAGDWLLDICPDGLGSTPAPAGTQRLTLRPEAHRAPGAEPARTTATTSPSDRPRVLVSFGSVFSDPEVVEGVVRGLVEGEGALDVEVVATAGLLAAPDASGLDPARARIVPFQPMGTLLEETDAVVTHGGAGTVLAVLSRGIPLVVTPQGADQFVQAAAVERLGAGIALTSSPDPADLRAAVRRILDDPAFARAARSARDEITAMASPDEVAADLAAQVGQRATASAR